MKPNLSTMSANKAGDCLTYLRIKRLVTESQVAAIRRKITTALASERRERRAGR